MAPIEAAVADSGLRPRSDPHIYNYWLRTVAGTPYYGEQGNRVDPTPLFDLPFGRKCAVTPLARAIQSGIVGC